MIPKSCRLFGKDHAAEQRLRAKSRFNLKRFRSKAAPRKDSPSLFSEQFFGRGDQADSRISGAIFAELLGVGDEFFRIDDGRIFLVFVVAVKPGQDDLDLVLVGCLELLARSGREIDDGGRGRGTKARDQRGGEYCFHSSASLRG